MHAELRHGGIIQHGDFKAKLRQPLAAFGKFSGIQLVRRLKGQIARHFDAGHQCGTVCHRRMGCINLVGYDDDLDRRFIAARLGKIALEMIGRGRHSHDDIGQQFVSNALVRKITPLGLQLADSRNDAAADGFRLGTRRDGFANTDQHHRPVTDIQRQRLA